MVENVRVSGVAGSKVRIERLLRALKQIRGGPPPLYLRTLDKGGEGSTLPPYPLLRGRGSPP